MKQLTYVQLKKEKDYDLLLSLMLPYNAELDAHHADRAPTPIALLEKITRGMLSMQGPCDRHLEAVYDGESLIGFAYYKVDHVGHRGFIKPDYGYIMEFYIYPPYRRKGYGRKVFRHIASTFVSHGTKWMYLTADPVTGEPFWTKLGFIDTGETSPENKLKILEKAVDEPTVTLIPLLHHHLPYLHTLLNEPAVMNALHMPPSTQEDWEEAIAAWQSDSDEEVYIIEAGGTPVGWMKLNGLDTPDAWLSMLAVGTAYQRQGYGSRAVTLAEEMLRDRGYKKLRIHTNEDNLPAQRCYEGLGYSQIERSGCTNGDGQARIGYTYVKALASDLESVKNHWYAYAYDWLETETDDVNCLLLLLGRDLKRILEVCCGGGRILVPLAKAGHDVAGFDMDEDMLSYIPTKAAGLDNIRYYKADALKNDWSGGYDTVVLAGNILINIETSDSYESAQKTFIFKAANALKTGGCLYLDFNLFSNPEKAFNSDKERVIFSLTDDTGVQGVFSILSGIYDPANKLCVSRRKTALTTPAGETRSFTSDSVKYIPSLDDVHNWLSTVGLEVEAEYGGYDLRPIDNTTSRAIILARKKRTEVNQCLYK